MTLFTPGPYLDELHDRLHAMGSPPPSWGRKGGQHTVWIRAELPSGIAKRHGTSLEVAARNLLLMDLTATETEKKSEKKAE